MVEINASAGARRLARIAIKQGRYPTRPVRGRPSRAVQPGRDWSKELRLQLVMRLIQGVTLPNASDGPPEAQEPSWPPHRIVRG